MTQSSVIVRVSRRVVKEYGAIEGGKQILARLEEYLAKG